jgi:hypothetical protein
MGHQMLRKAATGSVHARPRLAFIANLARISYTSWFRGKQVELSSVSCFIGFAKI